MFFSDSAQETQALGRKLARLLKAGDVLGLRGPLGSGKTTFMQGLARGMKCDEQPSSPTFVLAQTYHGARMKIHHLDFYRLKEQEALAIGLDDFYRDHAVTAIEWMERARHLLPRERLDVIFQYAGADQRKIRFVPQGDVWVKRLKALKSSKAARRGGK